MIMTVIIFSIETNEKDFFLGGGVILLHLDEI